MMFIKKQAYDEIIKNQFRTRQMQNEIHRIETKHKIEVNEYVSEISKLKTEIDILKLTSNKKDKTKRERELKEKHKYAVQCLKQAYECLDHGKIHEAILLVEEYEKYVNYEYQEYKEV